MNIHEQTTDSNASPAEGLASSGETNADRHPGLGDIEAEPLSLSMLGKFFGVPLLIIGLIVGGAVCVVLLFGGPATAPHRTVWALLQSLEANSGERSLGLLLTREKELWQTALELSDRLEHKDSELTPEELREVADRLTRLLRVDLDHLDSMATLGDERVQQAKLRSTRLVFLIRALGRTGLNEVIPPLLEVIRSRQEPYSTVAIHELANLHELVLGDEAVKVIARIVRQSDRPETLLTACPALSVLAKPGNPVAVEALKSVYLKYDGEVSWSAAISLARLGSEAGKSSLLDLLDRRFWESADRYQKTDEAAQIHRYPMPPGMIERWLLATLDVVVNFDDPDLWKMVDRLKSDPSLSVRAKANEISASRT